jgi:MEDS: MEthanogen/methylotroph, DcmR Sensory domain
VSGDGEALGAADGQHLAHFYSDQRELAREVGRYIGMTLQSDGAALVLATRAQTRAFEDELRLTGIDLTAASAAGTYVTYDAHQALRRVMVAGQPDRDEFVKLLHELVVPLVRSERPLRVYGGLCGMLCDLGMFWSAVAFEDLWNQLIAGRNFTLLCGYHRSWSITDEGHLDAVRQLARRHIYLTSLPFTT